jgi:hypothetical protein
MVLVGHKLTRELGFCSRAIIIQRRCAIRSSEQFRFFMGFRQRWVGLIPRHPQEQFVR